LTSDRNFPLYILFWAYTVNFNGFIRRTICHETFFIPRRCFELLIFRYTVFEFPSYIAFGTCARDKIQLFMNASVVC